MKLYGKLVSPHELNINQRDSMFYLMNCYFEGVIREAFESDLNDKKWVIVLYDKLSHNIQGFSTLQPLEVKVHNQPIRAVYSGDTIINKKYWGETELASIWGSLILKLIEDDPNTPLYWFLISKGYRTYKFLPAYFNEFYPRYDKITPEFEQQLLCSLAKKKFSELYDQSSGVISCIKGDHLNKEMAMIDTAHLNNPHVRFFLHKNPNYWKGEELACLTLLSTDNFRPLAKRIFKRYPQQMCASL
jgi:hypothetical protein